MKRSHQVILFGILTLGLTGPVLAQSGTATSPVTPGTSTTDSKQWQNQHRLSKIIGSDVYDAQGKKIGAIKDVVMNPARGQVDYAVLSFGGVMGVGSKYFAIPWKSLQASSESDRYVVNVDRNTLKDAPGFDKDRWPDMANAQWSSSVERYWEGITSRQSSGSGSTGSSMGSPGNRTERGGSK